MCISDYCDEHLLLGLIFCVKGKFRLRHPGGIRLSAASRRLLAPDGRQEHLPR